jgi:phosphonate metabolism protein (transferase hexapeptide repeat family)
MKTKMLSIEPSVHQTAVIIDSDLGEWTEIGERTSVTETVIGDYSYVDHDASIIYTRIGKFCSIAALTCINPGNHPLKRASLHHFTYRSRQYGLAPDDEAFFNWRRSFLVTIEHDVWIGHGAIILPGVTIGTGAAIGAGAVVSKDVAPFTIAAGVPAKPIRARFSRYVQDALLQIKWWDWPRSQLKQALNNFRTLSAEDFIKRYGY